MNQLKDIAEIYGGLDAHPAFKALVAHLEGAFAAKQAAIFSKPPDQTTLTLIAQAQGFKECLTLLKTIPAGSKSAYDEMERAQASIWGITT